MQADFDLEADGSIRPLQRGRPKGFSQKRAKELDKQENPEGDDQTSWSVRKTKAAVDKLEADAANAWLKNKIESGEYLSRSAYREASATLLAELAQGLRSLPDTLERKYNLAPDVVEHIQLTVDEMLNTVAQGLELFVSE